MKKTKKETIKEIENCKNRKSDKIFYKIKDQLILYLIPILLGIVGYFLIAFFTGNSIDMEKNAAAHEALVKKNTEIESEVNLLKQSNKIFLEGFKDFKRDLNKKLDRIEQKLDKQ
jgi:cell division protein FtsB